MTPAIAVVVPVFNNWWLTRRCLRALGALRARSVPFEVLVVDNASSDETQRDAGIYDVTYLRQESNRNFAGACNIGARHASAPVVLFLNNDAAPLDDPLPALLRAFDDPSVVIAGGKLLFEDGAVQSAGMALLENAHWWLSHRNLPESTTRDDERPVEMAAVSGAAMAVRRDWFVSRGGFDEAFINGFEDVDLCMRALREEARVVYVSRARFEHFESASAGRFDFESQNERRFYERWSRILQAIPRTRRVSAGTLVVRGSGPADPLARAAREDLIAALREIGHPVYDERVSPAHRIDEKFYRRCDVEWFSPSGSAGHAVRIAANERGETELYVRGMLSCIAPWLPGIAADRAPAFCLSELGGERVGVVCESDALRVRAAGFEPVLVATQRLLSADPLAVDAIVVDDDTDCARYGNALLGRSGVPLVTTAGSRMASLFTEDVVETAQPGDEGLSRALAAVFGDRDGARRRAAEAGAESRRRFSARRSAMRVSDLASAARFGPERAGARRADSPIHL